MLNVKQKATPEVTIQLLGAKECLCERSKAISILMRGWNECWDCHPAFRGTSLLAMRRWELHSERITRGLSLRAQRSNLYFSRMPEPIRDCRGLTASQL